MDALQARIMDIPINVFTDNILPLCEVEDVISLGCANKFFALVANDETYWKQKLVIDYNFTGSETGRTSDWKFLYQKFRNPRIFVWGCVTCSFICQCTHACSLGPFRKKDKGRLGLPQFPKTTIGDVPFPVELHLPGVRVVSLAASNGSVQILLLLLYVLLSLYNNSATHVLGSDGSVYVWGGCL